MPVRLIGLRLSRPVSGKNPFKNQETTRPIAEQFLYNNCNEIGIQRIVL
jgi:hypothetical protein